MLQKSCITESTSKTNRFSILFWKRAIRKRWKRRVNKCTQEMSSKSREDYVLTYTPYKNHENWVFLRSTLKFPFTSLEKSFIECLHQLTKAPLSSLRLFFINFVLFLPNGRLPALESRSFLLYTILNRSKSNKNASSAEYKSKVCAVITTDANNSIHSCFSISITH